MPRDPKIQSAMDAIGETQKDDWRIDPGKHAEALKERAPKLADALAATIVTRTASQYQRENDDAGAAKRDFEKPAFRAAILVFFTICAGVLLTVAGTIVGGGGGATQGEGDAVETTGSADEPAGLFIVLGLVGIGTSAFAAVYLTRVRDDKRLERFLETRAAAERRRLEYFDVLRTSGDRKDAELELLKLEYFRRYLVGSQRVYFENSAGKHRKAARSSLRTSSLAGGVAVIFTGSAGFLAAALDKGWAALAGAGIAATALATMVSSREAIRQDRSSANRYRATLVALEDLEKKRIEAVRLAVLAGDVKAHDAFAEAVNDILSRENEQWLETGKQRNAAIDQLDRTLRQLQADKVLPTEPSRDPDHQGS